MKPIETYRVTLKHDGGITNITVTTLSGRDQAIDQVLKVENCPCGAVQTVRLISTKLIK